MGKNSNITIFLSGLFGVLVFTCLSFLPKKQDKKYIPLDLTPTTEERIKKAEQEIELSLSKTEINLAQAQIKTTR